MNQPGLGPNLWWGIGKEAAEEGEEEDGIETVENGMEE
jgi:hypothetical protein